MNSFLIWIVVAIVFTLLLHSYMIETNLWLKCFFGASILTPFLLQLSEIANKQNQKQ